MRTLRSAGFLLLLSILVLIPMTCFAQFGVAITVAPPPLVVYSQPVCPQEGYLWAPGYWARSDEGYYWVPGTWVEPPAVGLLWTPGYWGWGDGSYSWNEGYWGPQVGFYGGVNYGFGYGGVGYQGGYWHNNQFRYNTYVNNVRGGNFHNTYSRTVSNSRNYVSYNGGSGGINARPTAAQQSFARQHHDQRTAAQTSHERDASQNHELLASVNHGHPAIAATSRPGEFSGKGVVAAAEPRPRIEPPSAPPLPLTRAKPRPTKTGPPKLVQPRTRQTKTKLLKLTQPKPRQTKTRPLNLAQPRTRPARTELLQIVQPRTRPARTEPLQIVQPRTRRTKTKPPQIVQPRTRPAKTGQPRTGALSRLQEPRRRAPRSSPSAPARAHARNVRLLLPARNVRQGLPPRNIKPRQGPSSRTRVPQKKKKKSPRAPKT